MGAVRRGQVFVGKKWCVASKLHVTSWKAALYVVTAVRISNHAEGTLLCILKQKCCFYTARYTVKCDCGVLLVLHYIGCVALVSQLDCFGFGSCNIYLRTVVTINF